VTSDTLHRVHLEARRTYLIARLTVFRDYAFALRSRATTLRAAGNSPLQIEQLALKAEERCYRFNRALLAIEGELDEGHDAI
jgi:hypothetical protein